MNYNQIRGSAFADHNKLCERKRFTLWILGDINKTALELVLIYLLIFFEFIFSIQFVKIKIFPLGKTVSTTVPDIRKI